MQQDPTLGEVIRRLDEIVERQERMLDRMDRDRVEAAKTYVRQDVYSAERQVVEANVADVRTDIAALDAKFENAETKRRGYTMWLGTLSVTVLLGVAGLLVTILQG